MNLMACRALFLLPLALMSAMAVAADSAQQALYDSYACALRQHDLLTDFHLHSSDPKDKIFSMNFEQSRVAATGCVKQVSAELAAVGLAPLSAELNSQFNQFDTLLTTNLSMLAKKGATEYEVQSEMLNHGVKVEAALAQAINELSGSGKVKANAEAKKIRDLAVLMADTSARYIERTTQVFPGSYSDQPTIDELAKEIEKSLAGLLVSPGLAPDMQKKLATINTKFRFIRGSLINYNESPVAFTVKRHFKTMSTMLMAVADQLQPLQ